MGVFVFLVLCAVVLIHYKPEVFKKVSLPPLNRIPLLLALSFCIVTSNILVNYLILLALNIQASFLISLVLMVVFQVGLAVPSSPGKVGVFQYLSVVTLGLFGIEKAQGLAFGLVWHLLIFIPFALLAALFWFFRDHFPRPTIAKEDMYVETG
jgi:uncharacterized membrane protein YbhN (UPF0104 family)